MVAHLLCLYSIWRLKVVNLKMDHFLVGGTGTGDVDTDLFGTG